jgi:hypothetical protein
MEPGGSLPYSQELVTDPHPEPDQSSPHTPILFSLRPILLLYSHICLGIPSRLIPSSLPTAFLFKACYAPYHPNLLQLRLRLFRSIFGPGNSLIRSESAIQYIAVLCKYLSHSCTHSVRRYKLFFKSCLWRPDNPLGLFVSEVSMGGVGLCKGHADVCPSRWTKTGTTHSPDNPELRS